MKEKVVKEFKKLTLQFFKKHKLKISDILGLVGMIKFWLYKSTEPILEGYFPEKDDE